MFWKLEYFSLLKRRCPTYVTLFVKISSRVVFTIKWKSTIYCSIIWHSSILLLAIASIYGKLNIFQKWQQPRHLWPAPGAFSNRTRRWSWNCWELFMWNYPNCQANPTETSPTTQTPTTSPASSTKEATPGYFKVFTFSSSFFNNSIVTDGRPWRNRELRPARSPPLQVSDDCSD